MTCNATVYDIATRAGRSNLHCSKEAGHEGDHWDSAHSIGWPEGAEQGDEEQAALDARHERNEAERAYHERVWDRTPEESEAKAERVLARRRKHVEISLSIRRERLRKAKLTSPENEADLIRSVGLDPAAIQALREQLGTTEDWAGIREYLDTGEPDVPELRADTSTTTTSEDTMPTVTGPGRFYSGRLNSMGDELVVHPGRSDWGDAGWFVSELLTDLGREPSLHPKVFHPGKGLDVAEEIIRHLARDYPGHRKVYDSRFEAYEPEPEPEPEPEQSAKRYAVAALYVEADSVYQGYAAECYDEDRDATTYAGDLPIVAHPPCRAWGKLKGFAKGDDRHLAIEAVQQVREFGGVLEHPVGSTLFAHMDIPLPEAGDSESPVDEHGGWVLRVKQWDWAHQGEKETWLYICPSPARMATPVERLPPMPLCITDTPPRKVQNMSQKQRKATPAVFAEWLCQVALCCADTADVPSDEEYQAEHGLAADKHSVEGCECAACAYNRNRKGSEHAPAPEPIAPVPESFHHLIRAPGTDPERSPREARKGMQTAWMAIKKQPAAKWRDTILDLLSKHKSLTFNAICVMACDVTADMMLSCGADEALFALRDEGLIVATTTSSLHAPAAIFWALAEAQPEPEPEPEVVTEAQLDLPLLIERAHRGLLKQAAIVLDLGEASTIRRMKRPALAAMVAAHRNPSEACNLLRELLGEDEGDDAGEEWSLPRATKAG